jgi:ABC-type transport system involved in multi-copper enzyme maturation permease subunit
MITGIILYSVSHIVVGIITSTSKADNSVLVVLFIFGFLAGLGSCFIMMTVLLANLRNFSGLNVPYVSF